MGPLDGIRVIEFATYVTGPYAGALLAELGAEVIKVEERQRGDPFRGWGTDGYSPTFRSVNRGKRSVAIDVRQPDGRAAAWALAARADVLIENFRPGVMERLGLGRDELATLNPRLVYCSITGFGSSGPYRDRPGYDTVGQAMSGLLSLLTDLDRPEPMGISLSDHITGSAACTGILAALLGRATTGRAPHVQTSLLEATTSFVSENAARFFADGQVPTRATRAAIAQAYAFVAGDGLPFVVHLSSPPKFWEGLTAATGLESLRSDERFVDRAGRVAHHETLHALLQERFRNAPRQSWLEALDVHDVPAGPINRLDEVFGDPGVEELGMVVDVPDPSGGSMRLVGGPFRLDGEPLHAELPPPLLGADTEDVLGELGYAPEEIQRLKDTEVIR
jgi:crotonobetainyl-CoA:carnitine CoA-transferase CaiB-like acyl-CoA transferase